MTAPSPKVEQRHRDKADAWMRERFFACDQSDYEALVQAFAAFERDLLTPSDRLKKALERIAYLRPAGDASRATNTRKLVEQMERIALNALGDEQ